MNTGRREFLKGAAWMGAAAMAAGCMSAGRKICNSAGAPMSHFMVPPMKRIRVGFIGVGNRGSGAVRRIAQIPGCVVTAMSDINLVQLDKNQKWLKDNGFPPAKEWSRNGDKDAWKGLCDSDVCDVVYSVTPRPLHCAINVYAMDHGKHVFQEVPGAFNLIHKGKLGEIVQAEVGYTHDQRNLQYNPTDGAFWRIQRHMTQHGNYYPTHGFVRDRDAQRT